MKNLVILLFLLPLFISCSTDAFSDDVKKGFDLSGKEKSCTPLPPSSICTMMYTASDEYGSKCKKAGYEATQCACHDYICSEKLTETLTGFDLHGKKRSCPKKEITRCTRSLTSSDRYKAECVKKGFKAYSCDCHDHLCSESFDWKD